MHRACRKRHGFCEKKEPQKLRPSRQAVMRALCVNRELYDMDRIENSKVAEVFNNYPEDMRKKLMFLRQLTLETASEIEGINKLEETLIGESLFLRKLVLGIPAQASGKNLTRPLMPSAPQPSCVRATSPHDRKLGAGYVALPQMTGRRFGKPFILSPPTLALRFRQNNGPTPTGDYQPSRSLSMADSACNICTFKIIDMTIAFTTILCTVVMNILHNVT